MKTILITGGAGFIGSHLADTLLAEGHHVRIFDALISQVHNDNSQLAGEDRWPAYLNPLCERVVGDVRNHNELMQAMDGVDVVYHLAARVGVGQSMYEIQSYSDVNVGGTANLLDIIANDAAIRTRLTKLILASSMSNYGEGAYACAVHGTVYPLMRTEAQLVDRQWDIQCPCQSEDGKRCQELVKPVATSESKQLQPNSIYAITKKTQEEMCLTFGRSYGLPVVALRFFNTYGTRQALSNPYTGVLAIFCSRLLNKKPIVIYEDGQQVRDFVHVSDLVEAARLVMDHPDATDMVLNVGSGVPITVRDIALTLGEFMESATFPQVTNQSRYGDIRHCYADISKLKSLGFTPKVSFEQGLGELVEWVSQQVAKDSFDEAQRQLTQRGLSV